MSDPLENAVGRALRMMRENIGEPLTVDDMARAAMFSKFHFTRVFQRVTGVSPGRFLSALRLQAAKDLLLATDMNVADISVHVGYNSVGTFSSRFTRSVGLPPTEYRRTRGVGHAVKVEEPVEPASGVVTGTLRVAGPAEVDVAFLGLFSSWVPEGRPVSCAVQRGTGRFLLDKVPDGVWHLLVQAVATPAEEDDPAARRILVGSAGPIVIRDGRTTHASLSLRPARLFDPPRLLALPDPRTVPPVRRIRERVLAGRAA
ncbi:helix-turn-helix transcriptional regulator [Actinoplanes sp. LDG1-06]|uniref:Helix-turn-helix transcriptional regulator n=1 Tax=Paractinoplanes ovalisporus TaxID=2810368 RepID=A0ABS2AJW1_9ACTN|nr:AraC family transcriptional regulator [Actinoplanes ovalisporus]MBM2620107.1 helix-turn-helix transcriptional regulator [Actinoplanes ovalisporus]